MSTDSFLGVEDSGGLRIYRGLRQDFIKVPHIGQVLRFFIHLKIVLKVWLRDTCCKLEFRP